MNRPPSTDTVEYPIRHLIHATRKLCSTRRRSFRSAIEESVVVNGVERRLLDVLAVQRSLTKRVDRRGDSPLHIVILDDRTEVAVPRVVWVQLRAAQVELSPIDLAYGRLRHANRALSVAKHGENELAVVAAEHQRLAAQTALDNLLIRAAA